MKKSIIVYSAAIIVIFICPLKAMRSEKLNLLFGRGVINACVPEHRYEYLSNQFTPEYIVRENSYVFSSHSISANEKKIVVGTTCGAIQLWDLSSKKIIHLLRGHNSFVTVCLFTIDEKKIVTGSFDQTVRIWDSVSGQCLHTLRGHDERILSIAQRKSLLASGLSSGLIYIWNMQTGVLCNKFQSTIKSQVQSLAWATDGKLIAAGLSNGDIEIWCLRSGQCLFNLQGHKDGVRSLLFTRDNKKIISGSLDGIIRIWEVRTGKFLSELTGHESSIHSIALTDDDNYIISAGHENCLRVWKVNTGICCAYMNHTVDWGVYNRWKLSYFQEKDFFEKGLIELL